MHIVQRIFKKEDLPEKWFDSLFIYMIVGIIAGIRGIVFLRARVLPRQSSRCSRCGRRTCQPRRGDRHIIACGSTPENYQAAMLWTFDRVMVPTGFTAAMIRFGNLMNHEIYGWPTDQPWGFRFITNIHYWMQGAEPIYSGTVAPHANL